jgi:hypothetical protein
VVAIQVLRVPEQGYSQSQLQRSLLDQCCACQDKSATKQSAYRNELQAVIQNQKKNGVNNESTRLRIVFTNCIRNGIHRRELVDSSMRTIATMPTAVAQT